MSGVKGQGTTHGMYGTPTYDTWRHMKYRCDVPTAPWYHRYGGRGITYDPRWSDFSEFYKDMGERPEGMSLDRIDNDKGYNKDNCRWATITEQNNNRSFSVRVFHDGKLLTINKFAESQGLKPSGAASRLRKKYQKVDQVYYLNKE